MRNTWSIVLGAAVAMLMVASAANAAEIRVKCEQRTKDGEPERSRVSVDAKNLDGLSAPYSASIISGTNSARSDELLLIQDEVEADFDSNEGDVAAGATEIPANFVQGSVYGKIVDADGFTVVADTASCR
jgi:hypothetical protein